MRNCTTLLPLLMSLFFNAKCGPISQPDYENAQYVSAQNVPTLAYKPQQIQYKQAAPRAEGLQYYASQQQQKSPPTIQTAGYAPVRQVFVPTSQGPRQIDPNLYDQALKAAQQQATLRAPASPNQQQQQIVYQPQQVKYVPQPQQVKYVSQPQQVKYVSQPQQVKYVAQPQYSAKYQQAQPQPQRPPKQGEEDEEEEGDYDPNPSYQFGFDVKDDQYTNYQTRKEERDGKTITGSYSVVDADGYIRTVKYTADPKEGFKAEVSREPTDIKIKIPKPHPQYQNLPRSGQPQQPSRAHQPQYIQVGGQRAAHRGQEEENVVYQYQ